MTARCALLAVFAAALAATGVHAAEEKETFFEFKSGPERVRLVELFTSQSRSPSVAADRWLNALKEDPGLWKSIVPVAFHVDLWDGLGWRDRLAKPPFTKRLQAYVGRWKSTRAYVPTIAVDGTEWSGWAREERLPAPSPLEAGRLQVRRIGDANYRVQYVTTASATKSWMVHGALLGFDVDTRVGSGENMGKTLLHDFAALNYDSKPMERTREGFLATIRLPKPDTPVTGWGVAVWVSPGDDVIPAQAAGARLSDPGKKRKRP